MAYYLRKRLKEVGIKKGFKAVFQRNYLIKNQLCERMVQILKNQLTEQFRISQLYLG